MTTALTIVSKAASQIGTVENPFNSNRQPYGIWYGWNGVAWCDIFVSWVFGTSDAGHLIGGKYAYTPYHKAWFRDSVGIRRSSAKVGDVVFFDFYERGYPSHVGIVEKVFSDGTFQTIEGNTSAGNYGSQNNGGGVYRRIRNYTYVDCFASPKYSASTSSTNDSVKRIQSIVGAAVDGIYGPETTKKVAAWQKSHKVSPVDGEWGPITEKAYQDSLKPKPGTNSKALVVKVQAAVRVASDGMWGPNTDKATKAVANKSKSDVRYLQARVGTKVDGIWGPNSESAWVATIKRLQAAIGTDVDGIWGPNSKAALSKSRSANYNKW